MRFRGSSGPSALYSAGAARAVAALLLAVLPSATAAEAVRISRGDCARLAVHRPAPDVAYRPGVDARGRKVAPADLPGSRTDYELPEVLTFEVALNPLRGDAEGRFGETALAVGTVAYDRETGRFTLDGRPLADPNLSTLSALCQRASPERK